MRRSELAALMVLALALGTAIPLALHTATLPGPSEAGAPLKPVEVRLEGVRTFGSYEELSSFLRRALARLGSERYLYPGLPALPRGAEAFGFSATNVQVAGIDELDPVKTDGKIIAVATGSGRVYLVDPAAREVASTIDVGGWTRGLFLRGGLLVVVYELAAYGIPALPILPVPQTATTVVAVYDVSDPRAPRGAGRLELDGYVLSGRLSGSVVYLVVNRPVASEADVPRVNGRPLPVESIYALSDSPSSYTTVVALDLDGLRYSVQTFLTGDGDRLYMTSERLYIASYTGYLRILASAYLRVCEALMEEPGAPRGLEEAVRAGDVPRCSQLVNAYLRELARSLLSRGVPPEGVSRELERLRERVAGRLGGPAGRIEEDRTEVYVFGVRGLELEFRGSVEVGGRLLDQFAIEELGGYLVLATTSSYYSLEFDVRLSLQVRPPAPEGEEAIVVVVCSGSACTTTAVPAEAPRPAGGELVYAVVQALPAGESSNSVFTVDLGSLEVAGALRDLARGERVYSARLLKDVLYLVTFRQVDPLFAIDLSDPRDPRVLGFLKVPGFSEYLHPLSGDLLMGVGAEDGSLKVSLFDVSDPRSPEEVSKLLAEGVYSPVVASDDYHAFTLHAGYGYAFVPVTTRYGGGGVLVVGYEGGLTVVGLLKHAGAFRTVYIGGEVYTISEDMVKVFELGTLREVARIPLAGG